MSSIASLYSANATSFLLKMEEMRGNGIFEFNDVLPIKLYFLE